MRALSLLLACVACADAELSAPPNYSAIPSDTAVIWHGFHQDWGYNHRLNRLGDWVGPLDCADDPCAVELGHSAASGLGSDLATWTSAATALRAPGSGFRAGVSSLVFREPKAEGTRITRRERVTVPLTGALADQEAYDVVLHGYDLMSLEDADMFRSMDLVLGEVEVDRDAGTASFDVELALELDCDRLECDGTWHLSGKLEREVAYGAHVMWLLVGTEEGAVTCGAQSGGYTWTDTAITDELEPAATTVHGTLPGASDAVLAMRALHLRIAHDSHFVSWATAIAAEPGEAGTRGYALTMLFKQWSAATWERANSYTTEGEAWTEGTVCALSLPGAQTAPITRGGSLYWRANGGTATSDRAVQRAPVPLDLPTLAASPSTQPPIVIGGR